MLSGLYCLCIAGKQKTSKDLVFIRIVCIFATINFMFKALEHKSKDCEHIFKGDEHKFKGYKYKIYKEEIKYITMANYVLQELPEELADGKKVVFPKMQTYSLHDYETVMKHMRDYTGNISEGLIRAVFDAFTSVMESWMPLGHTLKIDGLGVFSLSLGFDTSTPSEKAIANSNHQEEDIKTKYRHVCIKGINFKPDPELIKKMNGQTTFDRVETNIVTPRKKKYTREERIEKAKAIIEKNGYFTLTDYAIATDQCKAAASLDLRNIVADAASGITTRGNHSHKVWVANK